jgi:cytochrome-b5 reductase
VTAVSPLTADSALFTFSLQPGHSLGLAVGQHILLRVEDDGDSQHTVRQYTPVSPLDSSDSFQIAIKLYADGRMSHHVRKWVVGSTALWRGPFGNLHYSPNKYSHVGLLACGSGITPMIQVIRAIVENEDEDTFVRLVYTCRNQHDIMLKELLDGWTSHWNFSVLYALSRASSERVDADAGSIRYGDRVHFGRVNGEVVKTEMPPSGSGRSFVMVCGTDSFTSDMTFHLTDKAQYSRDMIHTF